MTAPVQDYILLGGERSPGKAVIPDANSPRNWDERKGYGLSGAYLVYTGDGLAKFGVEIHLWKDEQFDEWDSFAAKCLEKPPAGQRPKALGIGHPILNRRPLKIVDVVVEDVTGWTVDDYGEWVCTIKFRQFRAPKPALGRPTAAIPAVAKPIPTAQDAADLEIQRLAKQLQTEIATP